MLCWGLRQTGVCGFADEYFNQNIAVPVTMTERRISDFSDYADMILREKTGPNGVFGVKLQWDQLKFLTNNLSKMRAYNGVSAPNTIKRFFNNPRYIYVSRRDKVKQAVSWFIALQSQRWLKIKGEPTPFQRETFADCVRYSFYEIHHLVQQLEQYESLWTDFFSANSIKPLVLIYEEMVVSYEETLNRVLDYLTIKRADARRVTASPTQCQSSQLNELWVRRFRRTVQWLSPLAVSNRQRAKAGSGAKRKLLFVTPGFFYPESIGGSEMAHLHLLRSLKKRGWRVQVLCRTKMKSGLDTILGFERYAFKTSPIKFASFVHERSRRYQPDIILGHEGGPFFLSQMRILKDISFWGRPTLGYIHNIDITKKWSTKIRFPDRVGFIANSHFTARALRSLFAYLDNIQTILPPPEKKRCYAQKRDGRFITFINPVPQKGVDIALEVASRLPDERFLFVKGRWALPENNEREAWVKRALSLPNVVISEVQHDMREVYAVTDILLMPSQFIETFGRVIVEAHINGIPVVASNTAGIPDTLGKGGILIEPKEDIGQYVAAIKALRSDREFYKRISAAAFQNSSRPEFDPEFQIDQFVAYVEDYLKKPRKHPSLTQIIYYYVEIVQRVFNPDNDFNCAPVAQRSLLYRKTAQVLGSSFTTYGANIYARYVPEKLRSFVRSKMR